MVLDTDWLLNVITFSFDFISLNVRFHDIVLHKKLIAGSATATTILSSPHKIQTKIRSVENREDVFFVALLGCLSTIC